MTIPTKVICISGKAGAGKDTVARMMQQNLWALGNRVLITHYADPSKQVLRDCFGWDGQKDELGRSLLQNVGDRFRTYNKDFFASYMSGLIYAVSDSYDYVIIPDARYPNEIDYLKWVDYRVSHVRVEREDYQSELTQEQLNHPSENALDGYWPTLVIYNNGTLEDLAESVKTLEVYYA